MCLCLETKGYGCCNYSFLYPFSQDDYPHLLKVLSTQYYKLRRNQGLKDWIVTEARKEEIQNIVIGVMSKCSVYSHQMDSELGLSCSSSE